MKAFSLIARILDHIRKDGFFWTLRQSFRASGLKRMLHNPGKLSRDGYVFDDDTLYAYYDLNVNPMTFDAAWFCACAEMERRNRGLSHLALFIVPADNKDVREESLAYDAAVDRDRRLWRLYNVVISSMLMFKPEASVHVLRDLGDLRLFALKPKHVYPEGYSPFVFPKPITYQDFAKLNRQLSVIGLESFYRGEQAGGLYISAWREHIGAKARLVVITLRQYPFATDRNANLDAWLEFARGLDPEKYTVAFVPDTDMAYSETSGRIELEFAVYREAAFHPQLRAALYESAFLNMGTLSGPMNMAIFNRNCRYMLFKPLVPSAAMSTEKVLTEIGFTVGENLGYMTPYQKLVWEPDDLEVLRREFAKFEALAAEHDLPDSPVRASSGGLP